jgi:hypothetical protein
VHSVVPRGKLSLHIVWLAIAHAGSQVYDLADRVTGPTSPGDMARSVAAHPARSNVARRWPGDADILPVRLRPPYRCAI